MAYRKNISGTWHIASSLFRSPGPLRVLFSVCGVKEVHLSPIGPSAISQASVVEVPASAMHLIGRYAGYSAPELQNFGFLKFLVPVNIAVTPEFQKFQVPAEFPCRSNAQPRI